MPPGQEAQARKFYMGALGLSEVPKPPSLAPRGGAWFSSGTVNVHLGVETDFRPARKAHPAFVIDDLAAMVANLRGLGHEVADPERLEGNLRTFVDDPFGNRIELTDKAV